MKIYTYVNVFVRVCMYVGDATFDAVCNMSFARTQGGASSCGSVCCHLKSVARLPFLQRVFVCVLVIIPVLYFNQVVNNLASKTRCWTFLGWSDCSHFFIIQTYCLRATKFTLNLGPEIWGNIILYGLILLKVLVYWYSNFSTSLKWLGYSWNI